MKKHININDKNQKYYFGYAFDDYCKNLNKSWCKKKKAKKEKKQWQKKIRNYNKERKKQGFDNTELWNLDQTIALFILPRLEKFKEITVSYPSSLKNENEWTKILEKIIKSFQLITKKESFELTKKERKQLNKGLELFSKYFNDLWT